MYTNICICLYTCRDRLTAGHHPHQQSCQDLKTDKDESI